MVLSSGIRTMYNKRRDPTWTSIKRESRHLQNGKFNGSMRRTLPPEKPLAENPLVNQELIHLKLYQGDSQDVASDWEDSVTTVPLLHKACFEGYVGLVKELVCGGEDVDSIITDGPKLLRYLNGGFVTYTAFFLHATPLMMAAHQGHVSVIKALIRLGASVDQHDSLCCTAFSLAASSQRMDACRLLLRNGANINNVDFKFKFTPLILACRKNDIGLAKWLIKKGACVSLRDVRGRTALHYAAWNYNSELVRLLLSHRMDVNDRDYYGWSPLHYLVSDMELDPAQRTEKGDIPTLDRTLKVKIQVHRGLGIGGEEWTAMVALLDEGADPNHLDPLGSTPLHILASRLPSAVLHQGQVKVNECKKNEMLLISMMLLIDKDANLHALDNHGRNVIDICRSRDNYMADRLFEQLTLSVSLTSLASPSSSISMASTSTTMGFHRHFCIDTMEEEIRQLVDLLVVRILARKPKSFKKKYGKMCVIS